MLKDKGFIRGKKSSLIAAGLVLGGLALVVFLVLGSLDTEDPWLTPSEKVTVVVPKSGFTLKAGDKDSGLKEVKVTVTQAGGGQSSGVVSAVQIQSGTPTLIVNGQSFNLSDIVDIIPTAAATTPATN